MELECARDCCKVDIPVNSPLSYTGRDNSYIILRFSYSIRFILVRSCEILGRTEYSSSYFRSFIEKEPCPTEKIWFDLSTKKNGHEFQNFYIQSRSGLHSWQWDMGISKSNKNVCKYAPNLFLNTFKLKMIEISFKYLACSAESSLYNWGIYVGWGVI